MGLGYYRECSTDGWSRTGFQKSVCERVNECLRGRSSRVHITISIKFRASKLHVSWWDPLTDLCLCVFVHERGPHHITYGGRVTLCK